MRVAPDARAELQSIVERDGVLTPASVLAAAQSEASALHPLFTWDDAVAGPMHRLAEARRVIMAVKVQIEIRPEEPPARVRAFVSLADDRIVGRGYRPVQVVLEDPLQRAALLRTALAELAALRRKYAMLSELAGVFAALDQAVKTG